MSTCYASNNIHFNFPPIMNDGRNFANWQPESVINKQIQHEHNIKTDWEYRKYMTNNATTIMKFNAQEAIESSGINPFCQTNNTPSSNVPYVFKGTFDNSSPGFGYPTSDLKNPYLSREQLQARMISPSIRCNNINT